MIENKTTILTVKTADGYRFEEECDHFMTAGYKIVSSGHNGIEWWAVLAKPVVKNPNRTRKEAKE